MTKVSPVIAVTVPGPARTSGSAGGVDGPMPSWRPPHTAAKVRDGARTVPPPKGWFRRERMRNCGS